jgi:hypothetical protein
MQSFWQYYDHSENAARDIFLVLPQFVRFYTNLHEFDKTSILYYYPLDLPACIAFHRPPEACRQCRA